MVTAIRKALMLSLVLGCTVSVLTSGLFTIRLIIDGALSFAFVPVCEAAGATAVWARLRTRPYAVIIERTFDTHTPWLSWLVAAMAVGAFVPVIELGAWITPLLLSSAVPIAWSAYLDFTSSRTDRGRTVYGAAGDVVLQRAVAWPLAVMYFLGAIWLSDAVPTITGWIRP